MTLVPLNPTMRRTVRVTTDLIYKGIMTQSHPLLSYLFHKNRYNRPDLQRDYDVRLIDLLVNIIILRYNRPDLQRDYDHDCISYIVIVLSVVTTDLIYKGIMTPLITGYNSFFCENVTTDLIYKGIMTHQLLIRIISRFICVTTDLIYKGIMT